METAVTYNRYSPGPNQREESITGQLRENHRLAKQKEWTVIHDYIDRSVSAKTDERPAFLQMIKDAEKGLFKYVICYQTSRFARDKFDAVVYKRKLKKLGVRVIYSKMNIPDGPEGIILESVLEGLDEYYSQELRQKVIRGQYDNALEGKASGGIVPYGLKLDANKKYLIDEEKSPIVREIFSRYAAGDQIVDICSDLNNRGLRTQKGGLFNKNSLHRMLKQSKYIGLLTFSSKDKDLKDVRLENAIPAIISKELFSKVQAKIQSNKRKTSPRRVLAGIEFLLSGKAFDGNCGGALVGDSGTSKTGVPHYYYTCQNKKVKKICKTKSVKKNWLENIVVDVTKQKLLTPNVIEFISDMVIQLQEKNIDNTMLNVMQQELKNAKSGIRNIMNAIEQGIVTDTTKSRLLELEAKQAQLESQIKLEAYKINAPKVSKEQVIYYLEKFKMGEADREIYKEQIINDFVEAVVLYEDILTIAYKFSNEDDIIDVDITALKNSPDSVRMSLLNWSVGDSNP